ncbi:MAG: TrmB family transcriptional regulator [Nitrososphaerota archaeon]
MVTVERLVRLGLTLYEARAYVALIRRAGSTPTEVAKVAGVPRPRIYDVIDSLVAKGLAYERPGRTARFVAVPPNEAVNTLVSIHRERLLMLEADAEAVREELGPAFLEGSMHSDPLDYIELIRAPEAIAKRFDELQRSTEREMLVFSKLPAAVRVEENDVGLEVARTRVLRSVYEIAQLDDPLSRDGMQRFIDAGEQARFVEDLPMKMGVIDERIVMLAMVDPVAGDSGLTTLVIENDQLARCLKIAFEQVWATGIDFVTACERRGMKPTSMPV